MSDSSSRGIRHRLRVAASVLLSFGAVGVFLKALSYTGKGGTQVDAAQWEGAHTTFDLMTVPLLLFIMIVVAFFLIHIHTRNECQE